MEITAYVEPIQGGKAFRARVAFPFVLEATGATKQDALDAVRDAVNAHAAEVAGEFVPVPVAIIPKATGKSSEMGGDALGEGHPFAPFFGMLPDDDLTREWEAIMAKRREEDTEERW